MVKQSVFLKAELEGVSNIYPEPHKIWFVKLKCSNCGETPDNFIGIDPENIETVGKANVNLLMSCKMCKRENSVLIDPSIKYADRTIQSEEEFEVVRFDCRGVEIEEFDPRDEWFVVSESGKVYDSIDLGSEWSEYEESTSSSLTIMEIQSEIKKTK
ncbi:hypothetical protein CYY_003346 [Polysphondylium violaceum]|uniref:DUF866 family protein n=1 Tax=Polysphondylium violaceum TaxID=133409 RepID=A0A8J4PWX4_9MYCE|nr:hypothetical protein CYY_003346 [Polysphondylium violaceum]